MKTTIKLLTLTLLISAQAGCGLLFVGAAAGVGALKKNSDRDAMLKEMKAANDAGDSARSAGNNDAALKEYLTAQRALNGFVFKYKEQKELPELASKHKEIERTAKGLIAIHRAKKHELAAETIDAFMLSGKQLADIGPDAVSSAPHIHNGKRVAWRGEVHQARHDPATDITHISVVPYKWVSRQQGFRSESYYDNTFKTWRKRIVPRYVNVKVPLLNKAFLVELRGYNEALLPGSVAQFAGEILGDRRRPTLGNAVAVEIYKSPNAQIGWFLGAEIPRS